MVKNLLNRSIHQSIGLSLLFYFVIVFEHLIASYFQSIALNLVGMILYPAVSVIFVKKEFRKEIRIKCPELSQGLFFWCFISICYVLVGFFFLYYIVGLNTTNFTYIMAKQQMSYGVVTSETAWKYFPIAAFGVLVGPFTEEIFFRGVLLKSFESKLPSILANIIQGFMFSVVHIAYLSLTGFYLSIIYTMIPIVWIAGVLYGYVAQRYDSIFFSILVHCVYNLILILLIYVFIIT